MKKIVLSLFICLSLNLLSGQTAAVKNSSCKFEITVLKMYCGPNCYYLEAISDQEILSVYWNFGDGTYAYDNPVKHTFEKNGIYMVSAKALFKDSCIAFTYFPDTIFTGNQCKVSFSYSLNKMVNYINPFDFKPELSGEVKWIHWDFGDGTSSEEKEPMHSFKANGIYKVTLDVIYTNDCAAYYSKEISIGNTAFCNGKISYYSLGNFPPQYVFYYDGVTDFQFFKWESGNGFSSEEKKAVISFEKSGYYPVKLMAHSGVGEVCEFKTYDYFFGADSVMPQPWPEPEPLPEPKPLKENLNVYIIPEMPVEGDEIFVVVNNTFPSGGCKLSDVSINRDSNIIRIHAIHSLGMLTYVCQSNDTFSIGKLPSGIYHIEYFSTLGEMMSSIYNGKDLTIHVLPGNNGIAGPDKTICKWDTVEIGKNFPIILMDPTPDFYWEPSERLENPKSIVTRAFPVKTTSYYLFQKYPDEFFGRIIDTVIVKVTEPNFSSTELPIQCFMAPCHSLLKFTDLTEGEIMSWQWDFGDGTGSGLQNPEHWYRYPGDYYVCLKVKTNSGSICSSCKWIKAGSPVTNDCHGMIELTTTSVLNSEECNLKASVRLINQNGKDLPYKAITWSTNDTGTTVFNLCQNTYYSVYFVLPDNCIKTASFAVISNSYVEPFLWEYKELNQIFNFDFKVDSTRYLVNWDFGNGIIKSGNAVSHTFNANDSKLVTVTISDLMGNIIFSELIDLSKSTGTVDRVTLIKPEISGDIKVYPNPVKDYLFIESNFAGQPAGIIQIVNLLGQVILTARSQGQVTALPVSKLKEGFYLVRIIVGNEVKTINFTKFQ